MIDRVLGTAARLLLRASTKRRRAVNFRNRIDEVVVFSPLTRDDVREELLVATGYSAAFGTTAPTSASASRSTRSSSRRGRAERSAI
jgi:hypothetical protein